MARYGKKAQSKVKRAMHERKRGTLRSGRSGKKVTSRKQAIAIGLSEARRAGGKVPSRSSASRRDAPEEEEASSKSRCRGPLAASTARGRRRRPATEYGQRPIEAGQPPAHGARDFTGFRNPQVISCCIHVAYSLRLLTLLCLVLCTALGSPPVAAQDVWDTVPSLDVVRSRLSLTPEQEARISADL